MKKLRNFLPDNSFQNHTEMKNSLLIAIFILLISNSLFLSCTEEPILFDLPDTYLSLDTLFLDQITSGTYQTPPLMGPLPNLYFGSENGYTNNFTLIRVAEWSQTGNIVHIASLTDSNRFLDSLVFTLTLSDSVISTETSFDLFYFPESGDSLFSEMSHYQNITEGDMSNAELISTSALFQAEADPGETITPVLSFKIDDIESVANALSDTSSNNNLSFLIKESSQLDKIIAFKSRESGILPSLTAYYRTATDTLESNFFAVQDISILVPAELSEDDKNFITVCRAKGLKSILQFSYDTSVISREELLIQSAKLFMTSNEFDTSNFRVSASPLLEPIELQKFWAEDQDNYEISNDITIDDTLKQDQMVLQIRAYLQAINNQDLENNGLKFYANINSDPFKSIHFRKNQDILESLNSYIRVLYVAP